MFDPVPWFVGGGAQHSPEVARQLAYAATGGAEGVVAGTDLKVAALAVPGAAVRVLPGAVLVLNRAVGGSQQTYVARMPTETQVELAATGSGAGRSDLIVAQVEDPFMAGEPWQDPANPAVGPYVFVRVIPNVPPGTRRLQDVPGYEGRSAATLARVDLPASTGTVTGALITDLRTLPSSRTQRSLRGFMQTGTRGTATDHAIPTGTVANYASWPIRSAQRIDVLVPAWATRLDIVATFSGVNYVHSGAGDSVAGIRTLIGTNVADNGIIIADSVLGGQRGHYVSIGVHTIPANMRGTVQKLDLQGVRTAGAGRWYADYQTNIAIDWQFSEELA